MEILTSDSVEELSNILKNDIHATDGMNLRQICDKFSLSTFEVDLSIDDDARRGLANLDPKRQNYSTLALLVRKALGPIDYAMAKDSRFWLSLVFSPLGVLATPPPSEESDRANWISAHWFAVSHRDFLRNHSISQFWWTYEIFSRQNEVPILEVLELFDTQKDLRSQIVDRTAINGNSLIIGKVLKLMNEEMANNFTYDRARVRDLFKRLNLDLGRRELEVLSPAKIEDLIRQIWSKCPTTVKNSGSA